LQGEVKAESAFQIQSHKTASLKKFFTISRSVSLSLTVWKSCRMAENHMEWLREHMRNHIDGEGAIEPAETVLSFRRAPAGGPRNQDTEAVALVYQAADVVKGAQERAAQIEARAEELVKRAIEKLQIAEERIRSAELDQRAAESGLNEAGVRLQGAEKALQRAQARIAAVEAQLSAAELRARAAEARAAEAEKALKRIEHAIRTQILETPRAAARKTAAA
jgi:colicin import membrane protein